MAYKNLHDYESKIDIDVTNKRTSAGHTREWSDYIEMNKEVKDLVTRRWEEYGV